MYLTVAVYKEIWRDNYNSGKIYGPIKTELATQCSNHLATLNIVAMS